MKSKFRRFITNTRIIILVVFMILALILINPTFGEGVAIRSVSPDSPAASAFPNPIASPEQGINPRAREVITHINEFEINSVAQYFEILESLESGEISLRTNRDSYLIDYNGSDIGLSVMDKPNNNIRFGLDLEGGTRVMIEPVGEIDDDDISLIINNLEQRLNLFGVGDVTVTRARDLFGASFIVVEIAGSTEDEVRDLLSQQGVFEAQIGNQTVFRGGEQDILAVHRSADRAGLVPGSCQQVATDQHSCGYQFSITLSRDAAQRQADITRDIPIIRSVDGAYLAQNLTLYLDGEVVNTLRISANLRGNPVTDIQITGAGAGSSRQAAQDDAIANMRNMQTVLITGSLPVELNIVKADTVSPVVGAGFIQNAILAGLLAILSVIIVVGVRYREPKISLPMAVTMLCEVTLILGFAALIGWQIDMAAIAAIIIAVGSGVDHQIVIAEETLNRGKKKNLSWKKRLAKAFFIIMAAYFTLLVAMIPLWFAGAGLLKGFALTTIVGVTMGVLITRPAFAQMMEILIDD